MIKALVYFASSLMLLLAVSIVVNAFVINRSITTDCGGISVTVNIQGNEELASKLALRTTSMTTTTTSTTTTSTTIKTTSTKTAIALPKSDNQIFVKKCDIDEYGRNTCRIVSLADLDPSERDKYDPRKGNFYKILSCCKLGCVIRMVVDSILPHAKSGPNDHWKDAPPFNLKF